jgi:hypothetical protein
MFCSNNSCAFKHALANFEVQITETLAKEKPLLLNDAVSRHEKQSTNEACAEESEDMTSTYELCAIMCGIFKQASSHVASDFLYRWVQKSHREESIDRLKLRQHLENFEQEHARKLELINVSNQQLQMEKDMMISDEKNKSATEAERLKASGVQERECVQALFLACFENCIKCQELLENQENRLRIETLERQVQHQCAQARREKLNAFAEKATRELKEFRSMLKLVARSEQDCRKATQTLFFDIETSVLKIIENYQKKHELKTREAESKVAQLLEDKAEAVDLLEKSVEEKETCIVNLSETVALLQADLGKMCEQRDLAAVIVADSEKKCTLLNQEVHKLMDTFAKMQLEKNNLQIALDQRLVAIEKMTHEAAVTADNCRMTETQNKMLKTLNDEKDRSLQQLRKDFELLLEEQKNIIKAHDELKISFKETKFLSDKLRCVKFFKYELLFSDFDMRQN